MRISDWSSDVCSSDLRARFHLDRDRLLVRHRVGVGPMAVRPEAGGAILGGERRQRPDDVQKIFDFAFGTLPHVLIAVRILRERAGVDFDSLGQVEDDPVAPRSEEHPSELQSLMRNSYAVFFMNKKISPCKPR